LTDAAIRRPPDCLIVASEAYSSVVLSSPVNLSDEDKLEVLRRLDQFRPWHSLDEKRYCLVCGKIITGTQILVMGGTRGNGPLRLSCPTEHCHSIPMDWVLPTDEILALVKAEITAAEENGAVELNSISRSNAGPGRGIQWHNGITSRLRNFALHLKRAS
jgi:hypothetical protein